MELKIGEGENKERAEDKLGEENMDRQEERNWRNRGGGKGESAVERRKGEREEERGQGKLEVGTEPRAESIAPPRGAPRVPEKNYSVAWHKCQQSKPTYYKLRKG